MNIAQIRTLVAIADTGSFTAAADALYLTPSAVSHQIRDLENGLEVALFDRSSRTPRLNPHGAAVVERGREVLEQFDTLEALARSPGELGGQLMLGCVSGVSSNLVPLALASLRASHPALRISIEEGLSEALAHRVRRRELDAAIISELPDLDPELESLVITEEEMVVVAPRDCDSRDWREVLGAYPFIRLNRNAGMGKAIDRALREQRLYPQDAMELDSSEAVVSMVAAGLGAGVIPAGRLRHAPRGEVAWMPFGDPPMLRRVVLIERKNNQRSGLSRLVYDETRRIVLRDRK